MKKTLITFLLVLSLTLSLAGCTPAPVKVEDPSTGGDTVIDKPDTPDTPAPDEPDTTDEPINVPVIPEDTVVSVIACGDNIIHGPINSHGEKYGYASIYEKIASIVAEKDIAYINVETLIGGDEYGFSGYPNFNSTSKVGENLVAMGFDVMNLAHNHMLDAPGRDKALYLRNCAKFFEERNTTPIGYYSSEEDTENIRITEVKGIKIAWLAYTYDDGQAYDFAKSETTSYKDWSLNGHKPNTSKDVYIPFLKRALIEKQVAIAKEKADVVIVSAHWGIEDSYGAPNHVFPLYEMQKVYGQVFADCGVDVVIGMHPHVIQKTDWIEGKNGNKMLCAYSLGNLLSRMLWGRNMIGAMMEFDIVKNGATGEISITNAYMVPTICQYNKNSADFKIIPFSEYTEELAAAHGCHQKDATDRARGKIFSYEAIKERIDKTFDAQFLKEGYVA